MEADAKPWWQSKVIIGTAVAMLAGVVKVAMGTEIDASLQGQIVDAVLLLGQLGGGMLAIIGRFTAKTALK